MPWSQHQPQRASSAPTASRRRWPWLLVALAVLAAAAGATVVMAKDGDGAQAPRSQDASGPPAATGDDGARGEPQAPPPPEPPTEFTVAATGDFLIHSPVYSQALSNGAGRGYDFRPMFRYIKPHIRGADLAICHFETPMTSSAPAGYPVFNTPPSLARNAKSTGWDLCDTASNHTLDRGQSGVDATLRALRDAGIASHGSASSARMARRIPTADVDGVQVAFLAYTESTNGIPAAHEWSVNRVGSRRILRDAARAKREGARVVIVNLHWGDEYSHEPNANQRRLAAKLTRSDSVDAIIGQHVHVVQPIRYYNGKPVVFGEGNLVSNQSAACCAVGSQDGIIALLDFSVRADSVRVKRVRYLPVVVRRTDYAVIPIGLGLEKGLMDGASLRASYARTTAVVGRGRRVRPMPRGVR